MSAGNRRALLEIITATLFLRRVSDMRQVVELYGEKQWSRLHCA